jgi:nicotinamidase-related amidase
MMHHEDPSTAIHDALAPQPGDIVVRKTRVGAMSTTDLDRQLRDRGIDTLVLAGISTPRRAQIIDTATLRGFLSP